MPSEEEALAGLRRLIQLGLGLASSTTSGRIVLAKTAANIDPLWIPPALGDSVGAAMERAAASQPMPLSFAEVERILTSAWGVRKVSDELDELSPEPVAVTFTAQVHRGIHAGSPVAVKILRPGVTAAFRRDLGLVDLLLAPLSGAFPGLDPSALLAEVSERVLDECDLEHEASLMRRFGRALSGFPVVVPVPVTDLCRESVLVSSWLVGEPLSGQVGFEHDSTAAGLLRFVIGGLREGLVHCDLDADDVLVLDDGQLAVLDFGAAAPMGRERADLCLIALEAFCAEDPQAFGGALADLGLLEPGHGATALAVVTAGLGPLGQSQPSRLDADAVVAALGRLEGLEADAAALLVAARLPPGDLYPARAIAQLFSLIARIGASGVWRDQVRQALTEGWHA
jgi:hypothetical protein